jgi:hypothetical protein
MKPSVTKSETPTKPDSEAIAQSGGDRSTGGSANSKPRWKRSMTGPSSLTPPRSPLLAPSSALIAKAHCGSSGYVRPEDEPPEEPVQAKDQDGAAQGNRSALKAHRPHPRYKRADENDPNLPSR